GQRPAGRRQQQPGKRLQLQQWWQDARQRRQAEQNGDRVNPGPCVGVSQAVDQPRTGHHRERQGAQRANGQAVQAGAQRQGSRQQRQPEQQQAHAQPQVTEQQHQQVGSSGAAP